jgi:large subunit ribosomal protein L5
MSDEEQGKKPDAPEKGDRPEKPEKAPKAPKAPKAEKAEAKGEKAEAKGEKAEAKGEKPAEGATSLEDLSAEKKERQDSQALKAAKAEKKQQAQEKDGAPAPVKAKGEKAKGGEGKGKGKGKKEKKGEAAPFVKRTQAPRLREKFMKEILPAMMKEFGYTSSMAVPRLRQITLNMGLGQALQNAKLLEAAEAELEVIAGQKPVITKARKSIATFKLRQGQKIGCMVTLRRDRMYEFFDRLVTFALPRTRDFKGVSPRSFDGRGNYTMGIREQIVFPEIDYDKVEKIMGMNVCIVTTAKTDEEGRALLKHLGMPFRQ